ncbi:aminodeoxychorismate/anthranilate synthase component II [Hymenobacter busanensis]|uniref:Aminodeoxychorismate/anthranilate synthase component II n=1 Tax=Hymenobacter busanensis TaxID=2607656 RepID=A0A7L4ZTY7_9BACT|nr:aminodeoxychorismate/anthranilate synthase component II [Hymenobacter busanensis]KAA9339385.1 aminodeoxychorismate/anthranilate synthase component II [Hymenobacter busanensis]QHJ06854.1 aminodeoxychorismate/anthranilate synthase component II [Hymenobacter busanensis]
MKILVFDNYDSFTYNLVQVLRELGHGDQLTVRRNDQLSLDEVEAYDAVLLSPGPGIPSEAGLMPQLIRRYAPTKRMLGVCLGHQGIAESFGAELLNLPEVLHGVATDAVVSVPDERLFQGLPGRFLVGRYHSWAVLPSSMPACLEATAFDDAGEVMALRHRQFDVRGVQFHPESILTEHGHRLLQNWLDG